MPSASRSVDGIEPLRLQMRQDSARRRTTNKIQQDEKQGGAASAGDACEAPPSTSNNKIQRPGTLAHATPPPPAASTQRSPRVHAAPCRSPRQAQGLKAQAADQESLRLLLDDVLQKHTEQILQAIHRHTPATSDRTGELSECSDGSPAASVALVGPAEGPPGSGAAPRLLEGLGTKRRSEMERAESFGKALASGGISHATVANYAQVGEFLEICKEITRSSGSPWLFKFEEWLDWWGALKNPKGTRCVDKLVESPYFQVACALIILANTVFVAIDANTQMENYVHTVSETSHTKAQQSIFLVLYIIELFLRGASEGRYFFYGENMKWNWFDMGIIVTSILSDFVMSQNSLSFLRVARILKVVKVSRVFRGLRHAGLGELQRMVTQVTGSLRSLVGCFALLAFITYVFAIFFVYSLCDLPSVDDEHLEGILEFFGSVAQTMLTLLQATTGGLDWRDVYAVLSEAGSLVAFCFILYVLFFVIAVWNIITATFVEKMSKMAKPDNDALAMEERMKDFSVAEDLKKLLEEMDIDSSKTMSHAELKTCLQSPQFHDFLLAHGVHIYEASTFFEMLFERGEVDSLKIDTIVSYCLRIKGQATSLDLHTMRYEMAHGLQRTHSLLETLEGQLGTRRNVAKQQSQTSSCGNDQAQNGSLEPHN